MCYYGEVNPDGATGYRSVETCEEDPATGLNRLFGYVNWYQRFQDYGRCGTIISPQGMTMEETMDCLNAHCINAEEFDITSDFPWIAGPDQDENLDCQGNCIADIDCAGECGGTALEDNCGTCDSDASNDCVQDCADVWGGTAVEDECGVCGGSGPAENFDCDGNCLVEVDCNGECLSLIHI